MSPYVLYFTAFSAIACAMVSGVFLSFSDFVMRSLDKSERAAGIEAMQRINREVFRTLFMVLLIGMFVLSPVLIWLGWSNFVGLPSVLIIAGAAVYCVGVFAVTLFGNVPMNVRLDRLTHSSTEADAYWTATFYPRWTFWNHVRTASAAVASACFLLASLWAGPG